MAFWPTTIVLAKEWTDNTTVSGFVSSVYQKSDNKLPYNGGISEAGVDENGSFQGTRFGLNVNAKISDNLTVASQLFASREEENYNIVLDWAFASFRLPADLNFRAGKIKFPVGLVNEYVDVGYAYTFLQPPTSFYSEQLDGSQATREAYSGFSLLWDHSTGDWTVGADLFTGDAVGERVSLRKMAGLTLKLDWNYTVLLQASTFQGELSTEDEALAAMQGQKHRTNTLGVKMDWNNIIAYAEYAAVDQDTFDEGKATVYYTTLGYRISQYTPYFTHESLKKGEESSEERSEQTVNTLGLRIDFMKNAALKTQFSKIKVDKGSGLFELEEGDEIAGESVNMFGMSLDFIF